MCTLASSLILPKSVPRAIEARHSSGVSHTPNSSRPTARIRTVPTTMMVPRTRPRRERRPPHASTREGRGPVDPSKSRPTWFRLVSSGPRPTAPTNTGPTSTRVARTRAGPIPQYPRLGIPTLIWNEHSTRAGARACSRWLFRGRGSPAKRPRRRHKPDSTLLDSGSRPATP